MTKHDLITGLTHDTNQQARQCDVVIINNEFGNQRRPAPATVIAATCNFVSFVIERFMLEKKNEENICIESVRNVSSEVWCS